MLGFYLNTFDKLNVFLFYTYVNPFLMFCMRLLMFCNDFLLFLDLFICRVQIPSFLNDNNATVRRGLLRCLTYVKGNLMVTQRNIFNCLTMILNISLSSLGLTGFFSFFLNSCINSRVLKTKVLNDVYH